MRTEEEIRDMLAIEMDLVASKPEAVRAYASMLLADETFVATTIAASARVAALVWALGDDLTEETSSRIQMEIEMRRRKN